MKTLNFLFIAAVAVSLVSCGGTKEEEKVEKTTYTLDLKTSSLKWKGSEGADYFHVGSVKFTDGSVEMEGDKLVGGSFKIDMNSIAAEDATLPDEKKEILASHLKDTSFFFTAEYPEVSVTLNGYENGKLSTIIQVRGQEIKQDIPVDLKKDEKSVTLKGKFELDVSSLKMEGFEPDPESGEKIEDAIAFELEVTLFK